MKEISINIMDMPDDGVKVVFSDDIDTEANSPAHNLAGTLHILLTKLLEERDEQKKS